MEIRRYHFEQIDSTRIWAKAHLQDQPLLVTADYQSEGRGQFSRHWVSPSGKNILATYAFKLTGPTTHIAQLLAFCALEVLREMGLHPTFKLPNDLLVAGKKIAGAMAETTPEKGHTQVFVSLGLNVNMTLEELAEIDQPATSIAAELGEEQDREAILEQISRRFLSAVRHRDQE